MFEKVFWTITLAFAAITIISASFGSGKDKPANAADHISGVSILMVFGAFFGGLICRIWGL
jgi:hypothetical protein